MSRGYQIVGEKAISAIGEDISQLFEDLISGVAAEIEGLAGEAGLLIIKSVIDHEVERVAGKRYERSSDKRSSRWGSQPGYVVFGGRKVDIDRPRVRDKKGEEVELKSYGKFQRRGKMQESISSKMIRGVSSRDYEGAIEELCDGYGIKKSSVSRHLIKATREKLAELCERSLSDLCLCAIMLDGIAYKGQLVVVALGVNQDGKKHVLGLWQGATENSEVCKSLLEDLVSRGLSTERKYLWVIDGSKALRAAIERVFGEEAAVQRCQLHKRRNVKGHLPKEHNEAIDRRIRAAYNMATYEDARKSLELTIGHLERLNPSAAKSLKEGMEETLTLHKLGVPEALRKSLSNTNLIESCFSMTRHITRNVKRWRGGDQVQRWAATALLEAEKRFRRIRGYKALPALVTAINKKNVDDLHEVA